ncbi:unnamed protein product [Brugia timori]|uniref:Uncharacterized protein n=1 Tax=Brugia timori TaxID=42155 RepID=A0A0R3Q5W6_9BILA|nr:unnamed protein product [Brugia timori]
MLFSYSRNFARTEHDHFSKHLRQTPLLSLIILFRTITGCFSTVPQQAQYRTLPE